MILFFLLIPGLSGIGQTLFLKAGPSFSNMHYESSLVTADPFTKGFTGVNVIAGINYLKIKYLNLSTGIGYIRKGGIASMTMVDNEGDSIGTTEITEKMNYLTVNTTVNLKVPIKDLLEPYIFAGPRLDYLVSWKETNSFLQFFDDEGALNKISWGLLLGGGINFHFSRFLVGASFDYYLDFNKMVDYTVTTGTTTKVYDHTFTVNAVLGYKL